MNNYIRMINNCFHKVIDQEVNEDSGEVEEKTTPISNFKLEIIKRMYNEENEETEDLIEITSKFSHVKTVKEIIELKNFANVRKFKEFLSKKYSCYNFVGNDNDLEMIKEFINKKKFQEVKGTNIIGINESNGKKYFVNRDICFNSDFIYSDEFLLSKKNTINLKNTFSDDFLTNEDCKKLESRIFNFNIPELTFSLISYAAAMFLNPILFKYDIKMPNLAFLGEAGGAKSETKDNVFKNIFYSFNDEVAADIKPFGAYKNLSETNIIPFSIEEYKTHTMPKSKQEFVRTIIRSGYDKHITTKGHADQTISRYQIKTPIMITGESMFEEKASKERTIILQFAKKFHSPDRKKAFMWLKRNKKYMNRLGNSLLKKAMNIDEEKLIENYYLIVDEITANFQLPDRIINNIAVVLLGYNILSVIFKENEIQLPESKTALKHIIKGQREFNLEGEIENHGIIEQTIETFGQMANNNFLPQELKEYFLLEDDSNSIYVSVSNLFPEFTRYLKVYDVKGEFETRKGPFKQLLIKSKYFIGEKRKNNKRYVVLSMEEIKKADIDFNINFEETEELPQENNFEDNEKVYPMPNKENYISLTSGDKDGKNVITKKFNLETTLISDVANRIFFDENQIVYVPDFENKKVLKQCHDNLVDEKGKKLFNIGDDYFKKAFENRQIKF